MILGIETSTTHASLAVVSLETKEVVRHFDFVTERAHNAVIFEPVTQLLHEFRDDLEGVAVGLGPGSYGGVRVGIAVANGLSLVLGIPVIGVSSLEAWDSSTEHYVVFGDARRKTFFRANVADRVLQGEPDLVSVEETAAWVDERIAATDSMFVTADQTVSDVIPSVTTCYPNAGRLALKAMEHHPTEWPRDSILEPHYLRAPYITTPKPK
ncbi:MAG: tRNA (adenosine(37)-N6)-threonylcarbamoyltransferase complex dimerization subunit type 1 TsaB [Verrucomicrobiales bacterium]|nr:tRNA (adenosine(37)-N6)-threonylcarbamoyltransferase complex dimerization subunit type 1 TsaB [Verrucomicrobiales bacterium]